MLEPLGVPQREEKLYRILVARPNLTLRELAVAGAMSPATAKKVLAQLEDKGLVSRTPESRLRFVPTPPDLALEALIARREDELRRSKLEAARLLEQFHTAEQERPPVSPVDLVRGHKATRQRQIQVQNSAREQVRIFDRPPYVFSPDTPNPEELNLLEAGVRYRVIYDESSLDIPEKLDAAKICVAAGEEARLLSGVSIKLIASDRRLALIHDPTRDFQNSIIVHPSPLLHTLINYFDLLWEVAVPLFGDDSESNQETDIDEIDRQILAMLTVGTSDEGIAKRLGLGVRTMRRRLARVMKVLDVNTRFQAGVAASKRGWV